MSPQAQVVITAYNYINVGIHGYAGFSLHETSLTSSWTDENALVASPRPAPSHDSSARRTHFWSLFVLVSRLAPIFGTDMGTRQLSSPADGCTYTEGSATKEISYTSWRNLLKSSWNHEKSKQISLKSSSEISPTLQPHPLLQRMT